MLQVSKQWYSIGSGFKIKELIFKGEYSTYDKNWCTGELYEVNNMINNRFLSMVHAFNMMFLRRLSIHANEKADFKIKHLNKLEHLELLELKFFNRNYERGITFLNLPNLKTLKCAYVELKLVFNAPILTAVYMSASTDIRFRNLPTLKIFDCCSPNSGGYGGAYAFNRIKKIEVFRVVYNRNLEIIYNVLTEMHEVKEIRFDFRPLTNCMDREYFETEFANIFEERRRLNKVNVQIFMFDILIIEGKHIDEYGFEKVLYKGKLPFHIT